MERKTDPALFPLGQARPSRKWPLGIQNVAAKEKDNKSDGSAILVTADGTVKGN